MRLNQTIQDALVEQRNIGDHYYKLSAIVLKILLYMVALPDLLTPPVFSKHIKRKLHGQKKKSRVELWKAGKLGRSGQPEDDGPATGARGKYRTHWRRGHWRIQRHGTGRKEIKLLFIDPTLINAPAKE